LPDDPKLPGEGDTPALLAAYGTMLGLAFLVLLVFASFKTYSERPEPTLLLLPQEDQSFCGQSRQTDGSITANVASISGDKLHGWSDFVVSD
jgi:hypothetical protein